MEHGIYINMTPDEIVVYSKDKKRIKHRYPPSGFETYVEISATPKRRSKYESVPLMDIEYGKVIDFPRPGNFRGNILIVDPDTLRAVHGRGTIMTVAPDYSPDSIVRDKNGRILGVRRFVRMFKPTHPRLPEDIFRKVMEELYPDIDIRNAVANGAYIINRLEKIYRSHMVFKGSEEASKTESTHMVEAAKDARDILYNQNVLYDDVVQIVGESVYGNKGFMGIVDKSENEKS